MTSGSAYPYSIVLGVGIAPLVWPRFLLNLRPHRHPIRPHGSVLLTCSRNVRIKYGGFDRSNMTCYLSAGRMVIRKVKLQTFSGDIPHLIFDPPGNYFSDGYTMAVVFSCTHSALRLAPQK